MQPNVLADYLSNERHTETEAYFHARLREQISTDGSVLYRSLKLPYLPITVPFADWDELLTEARALENCFVGHREDASRGWKSLCIHGLGAQKTMAYMDYGYTSESSTPYTWTEIADRCPLTVNWLKTLLEQRYYERFFRVRYMWLDPEGFIAFHRDRPEGSCELGPLNVALNMPEGCEWIFKKWGRVPFQAGSAMCVDISNEHAVFNFSQQSRVHLILHGAYGPAYYQAIATAAKSELQRRGGI